MYKKGRSSTQNNINMDTYILRMVKWVTPLIKRVLPKMNPVFINTRELDDILCDLTKNDKTLSDGKKRWIEIHRSVRVRIISKTLVDTFGYIVWSGNTRKVFYKPTPKSAFMKASDIKKGD